MIGFVDRFASRLVKHANPKKQRLGKILSVAGSIAEQNPEALVDYVRLLGRKLQSDYMCRAISWLDERRVPDLEANLVWFDEFAPLSPHGESLYDLKQKVGTTKTLSLSSDIVLPWPWNLYRISACMSAIGPGRRAGEWKQDETNHKVEYWLPFGIGWVHGGNHSIMTGIVQGQGTLKTDRVYDLSALFSHVRFDGDAFIRESDGKVIQRAPELEFAAIFEVGRLMHERGVSA